MGPGTFLLIRTCSSFPPEAVRQTSGAAATGPRLSPTGSAAAVEAELDHPGGDQARTLAAGVAADIQLRRQDVEAALRGSLADIQRLGQLGAGGRASREGPLAAVRGDERRGRGAFLLAQSHCRPPRRDRLAAAAG